MYKIRFTKLAISDIDKLKSVKLDSKAKNLIEIIKCNPYETYPPYEKLVGDLLGLYSRRINIHHRLVYSVNEQEKTITIIRMWNHY